MDTPEVASEEDLAQLFGVADKLSKDKPLHRNRFSAHKDSNGDITLRNQYYAPWSLALEKGGWITLNGPGYEKSTLHRSDQPTTITRDLLKAIGDCLSRKSNPGTVRNVQEFGEIPPAEDVEGFTAWYQRMAMAIVS